MLGKVVEPLASLSERTSKRLCNNGSCLKSRPMDSLIGLEIAVLYTSTDSELEDRGSLRSLDSPRGLLGEAPVL